MHEPETWQELKVYPLLPDDVILSSYPRSGTTWMQHILRLLRNGGKEDGVNLDDAVPWLEALKAAHGKVLKFNPNAADILPSPRTLKVHLPYQLTPGGLPHTTNIKYIYIARNPKDESVSLWHFAKSQISKVQKDAILPWEAFFANFLEAKAITGMYGGWLSHVLGWWVHRDEPNILFLKYEDLKKDPHKAVKAIGEFIGVEPLTEELVKTVVENSSFQSMSTNATINNRKKEGAEISITFLRKGIIGDWKHHYTAEQNHKFEQKVGEVLKENNLEFDYDQTN